MDEVGLPGVKHRLVFHVYKRNRGRKENGKEKKMRRAASNQQPAFKIWNRMF